MKHRPWIDGLGGTKAVRLTAFYEDVNDAIIELAKSYGHTREEACRLVARWLDRNAPAGDETSSAEAEEDAA